MKQDHEKLPDFLEQIATIFSYDTISLLDCVLGDDPEDPEFSAKTVFVRLQKMVLFENQFHGKTYAGVNDLLLANNYSLDHIRLLEEKIRQEERRYEDKGM